MSLGFGSFAFQQFNMPYAYHQQRCLAGSCHGFCVEFFHFFTGGC